MTRVLLLTLALSFAAVAQTTIETKTAGMQKQDGYFPLYYEAKTGKLFLAVDKLNTDFLYYESLPAGLGSNDSGLDRGLLGQEKLVFFERVGPKLLLVQRNLDYRAVSDDAAERRTVEDSFARSILYSFPIEAETGNTVLIEVTSFVVRDAMDVAGRLKRQNQGTFRLDPARSAIYMARTKAFPKNTETEATITFAGEGVGQFVSSVTPSPESLTLRVHHSFLELPPPGYQTRMYDPRSGYNAISYMDFATPVDKPIRKQFIVRHRLEKKDPNAKVSEAVKPLVYYIDRGAPEPIRTALLDGARWWNQAFEAIGYKNAFQVEIMPEGADPMDARYNIIQWVHRSTRGWSYGNSVTDPRTGEIIKGHVTLGSLRIRQDFMIAEAFTAPYATADTSTRKMMEMSLARIRQLSIHEIGHTLGLVHNFSASAFGRTSVMDYPAPLILMKPNGEIDLSDAYAVGAGDWDKVTIEFGYQHFAPGKDEAAELRAVLDRAHKRGMYLIADTDSRAPGGAHPTGHLWDNGANAVDELNRMMALRAKALENFGEKVILPNTPMSEIENKLVPLYMGHRYQVEAAAKVVGGLNYRYALRGDGQPIAEMIAPEEQRRAINALLETIKPETLTLPERLLKLMPPPAIGYPRTRESFRGRTGLTFDALAPVEAAAGLTFSMLLHPERASRLVQHNARDSKNPSLESLLDTLSRRTILAPPLSGMPGQTQQATGISYLYHLMALANDPRCAPAARAIAYKEIVRIGSLAEPWIQSQVKLFQEDPKQLPLPRPLEAPPGMPIGDHEDGVLPLW
jgi:hypothetical protein